MSDLSFASAHKITSLQLFCESYTKEAAVPTKLSDRPDIKEDTTIADRRSVSLDGAPNLLWYGGKKETGPKKSVTIHKMTS
jgi:hypothetical protein